MKKDTRGLRDLCAQVHEEDGRRPERRDTGARGAGRKDLQLCKQVQRALESHLAESGWASRIGVSVASVSPDPDASRLRVLVAWTGELAVGAVMELLASRRGELRCAAAAPITRRRAPQLVFGPAAREVHDE